MQTLKGWSQAARCRRWRGLSDGRGMRALLLCVFLAAGEASAQIPRLADGHPDLEGVWSNNFATMLQRPEDVRTLVVTAEEAKKLIADFNKNDEKVYDPDFDAPNNRIDKLLEINGELRSSLLIEPADGHLPVTALAKAAEARRKELRKLFFDNPEERADGERCVGSVGDPPLVGFSDLIPSQIVETPAAIVIGTEDIHGGRIIDMTGTAPPDAVRSRVGYSAGHWDGDTLVVVTDHFAADDPAGVQFRDDAVVSRASRVIEQFRLISPDKLLYRYTIEDQALYDRPWLAEVVMLRSKDRLYEYACHEGNQALPHILMAARLGRQKPPKDKPAKPEAGKPPGVKPEPGKAGQAKSAAPN
jgi:hypothetical protein